MSKNIKKLITLVLVLGMLGQICSGVATYARESKLTDIDNHWAKSYIEDLVSRNAITGYPDNSFRANKPISRAAFITVISKVLKLELKDNVYFDDTLNHWANHYIGAAYEYGLLDEEDYYVSDKGIYAFNPDINITRGEMAQIIVRAIGKEYDALTYQGALTEFTDGSQINVHQKGYIREASKLGIITGYPDKSFGADKTATRAEACVMIMRMVNILENSIAEEVMDSEEIYTKYSNNVVKIMVYGEDKEYLGSGSGFVISNSGKIVTNYHVITEATTLSAEFTDGTIMEVKNIVNYDIKKDVAIIDVGTISNNVVPVTFGNDRLLSTGSIIYTVGYPLDLELTISDGLISSKYYKIGTEQYLQISAPISSGNSGSPLVDKYGNVIGINVMSYTAGQNINLAIPISFVSEVLYEERSMTMEKFANRDMEVVENFNMKILNSKVYGIDKESGEKIYKEGNYFNSKDISSFGYEVVISHDLVGANNAMYVYFEMLDGDFEEYYYEIRSAGLSGTNQTLIDISFERFPMSYFPDGSYQLKLYLAEEVCVTNELNISDEEGIGNYKLSSSEIKFFNRDLLVETGQKVYTNEYYEGSLGSFGLDHIITFKEKFEDFETLLVKYEVSGPNYERVIYDTLFCYSDTNEAVGNLSYGNGDLKGLFEVGTYTIKAYIDGELIDESTMEVLKGIDASSPTQVTKFAYYNSNNEEVAKFGFDDYYDMGITVKLGKINLKSVMKLEYAVRSISEKPENVPVASSKHIYVESTDSYSNQTVMFDRVGLPFRYYFDGYPIGEKFVMDIYLDNTLVTTIDFCDPIEYSDKTYIKDLILTTYEFNFFETENTTPIWETIDKIKELTSTELSLEDMLNNYIVYCIDIDYTDAATDYLLLEELYVELVKVETGDVVAEFKENSSLLMGDRTDNYFIDIFDPVDKAIIDSGNYMLRIYYGNERELAFEKTFIVE